MLNTALDMRKKLTEFLSEEDILSLVSHQGEPKGVLSVRITPEGERILDQICAKLKIKRGIAIDLILREIRKTWGLPNK